MKSFTDITDVRGKVQKLVTEAEELKKNPFAHQHLGQNKTMLCVFFNPSLRTRLSTQKAAMNLGMNVIVLNVNEGAWKLETERGVIMDSDKPEHLLEAIPVIGSYCDIIGVRTFAGLTDRNTDYNETVLHNFIRHSGVPVVSLESATLHPLQSLADMLTIAEYKKVDKPKIVLSWAPHPRALPQAVANSFAEWTLAAGYDLTITHPKGYELSDSFTQGAAIEYDREKAFAAADFVYAKNWSSFSDYGKILSQDRAWTIDTKIMQTTNNAHFMHCLPVRRNMIVTDDVIEAPTSLVQREAANREFSAQIVLKKILEKEAKGGK